MCGVNVIIQEANASSIGAKGGSIDDLPYRLRPMGRGEF